MTINSTLALLVVVLLAGFTAQASAQDAAASMQQGVEARRSGNDEEALAHFQRAHSLSPSPRALAQIALAEQALGRWAEAAEHLSEALDGTGEWVDGNRDTLAAAFAVIREHVGQLQLVGGEQGAEVLIDGSAVGVLPLRGPVWVTAGTHQLAVRADGFAEFRRPLTIVAGSMARETIELLAAAEESNASDDAEPNSGSSDSGRQDDAPGDSDVGPAPWVLVGVGAAAVIAGAVLLGLGTADQAAVEDPVPGARWAEAQDAFDRGPTLLASGSTVLPIGIAAVAAGVIWALVGSGGGDDHAAVRPSGLGLEVAF